MKKRYLLVFFVVTIFILAFITDYDNNKILKFYYAFSEKIPLEPVSNTIIVKYIDGFDKNVEETYLSNYSPQFKIKWRTNTIAEISSPTETMKEELVSLLKSRRDYYTSQQLYSIKNSLDISIFDEIVVNFLPSTTDAQKNDLMNAFKTEIVGSFDIFQILRIPRGGDALEIANRIYESGLVEFSKPNFLSNFEPYQVIPNDPYFNNQITLHNTGQIFNDGHIGTIDADIDAPEAWEMSTGVNSITIAVIDEGVTSDHPDLPNTRQSRRQGSDFVDHDSDPSPVGNNNHGNACAGVIGATMNNNQGIAGIAPNCRIMPIRIDYNTSSVTDFALAIKFAADNGADVISNSWGLRDPYSQGPYSPNLYPEVVNAIQYAVNNGRSQKGCVVVFAAGNTANHAGNNNGYVSFPANVTINGVITVGASDRTDHQSDYSPTSDPNHAYNQIIDIVAPSHRAYPCHILGETFEMWSIDIPNANGYNPWSMVGACVNPPAFGEILPSTGTNNLSYTGRFGGTSHSCPVIAGVAALVLSVNPNLSQLQVFNILVSTADQVGGYTYTNGRCNELGYGRVNASAAVFEVYAPLISITGEYILCTSGSSYSLGTLPSILDIEWTCSQNISVNDPHTNPGQFYGQDWGGSGWIGATISLESCNCEYNVANIPVWSGRPWAVTVYPSGFPPVYMGIYSPLDVVIMTSPGADLWNVNWSSSGSIITEWSYGQTGRFYSVAPGTGYFFATPFNNCGDGPMYQGEVWVDEHQQTKVNPENEEIIMLISPNPSTTYFNIELISNAKDQLINDFTLEIIDPYARIIKKFKLSGPQNRINIQELSPGNYIVVVKINNIVLQKTLIKQ